MSTQRSSQRVWWIVALSGLLAGISCKSEAQKAAGNSPAASSVQGKHEAAASAPAPSSVEGDGFSVKMLSTASEFTAGSPAELQITLQAKAPYKCNAQYPYKFKFVPQDGVKTPDAVSKDSLKLEEKNATLSATITPQKVGKQRVEGTLSFSVCTADRCLIERKKVGMDILVN